MALLDQSVFYNFEKKVDFGLLISSGTYTFNCMYFTNLELMFNEISSHFFIASRLSHYSLNGIRMSIIIIMKMEYSMGKWGMGCVCVCGRSINKNLTSTLFCEQLLFINSFMFREISLISLQRLANIRDF